MIFITAGTTEYDFLRLFKTIEDIYFNLSLTEKTIIQVVHTTFKPKLKCIEIIKYLSYQDIIKNLKHSRLTICHGGISSIILAAQYCKNKAIVVPRYAKYSEHVNNHQVDFCKKISTKYPVNLLLDSNNFQTKLAYLITHDQKNSFYKKSTQPNQKAIAILDKFCSQISND